MMQVEQEGDYGEGVRTIDLQLEGANKAVTDENKQQYVDLYVQHLLDTSIKPQFDAFQKGFKRVCLPCQAYFGGQVPCCTTACDEEEENAPALASQQGSANGLDRQSMVQCQGQVATYL